MARQYRLATGILTTGTLAIGMLLLEKLVTWFDASFMAYYGVSQATYDDATNLDAGLLSVTFGQVAVVVVALFGLIVFVGGERRRVRHAHAHRAECSRSRELQVLDRPSVATIIESMVKRTSLFGGVMLLCWILQTSYERALGGLGWGLGYDDWRSVLPLASVFGLCLLVGLFVAAISLFGMRVLGSLESLLRICRARVRRNALRTRRRVVRERTMRELFGVDILSRPPPVLAV